MAAKLLFKNPVLTLGVLMMISLLLNISSGDNAYSFWPNTIATSCRSVIVKLEKHAPKNWNLECKKNTLNISIQLEEKGLSLKSENDQRKALYRTLANDLSFISKHSLNESLERTDKVIVTQTSVNFEIKAETSGKHLSQLTNLNEPQFVADHLKNTVLIKETKKTP